MESLLFERFLKTNFVIFEIIITPMIIIVQSLIFTFDKDIFQSLL